MSACDTFSEHEKSFFCCICTLFRKVCVYILKNRPCKTSEGFEFAIKFFNTFLSLIDE